MNRFLPKVGALNLWQGITRVMTTIKKGFMHEVDNGKKTRFWKDSWVEEIPFICFVTYDIQNHDEEATVDKFLHNGLGLKWERIGNKLSDEIKAKMHISTLAKDDQAQDGISLTLDSSGKYYVSSTYTLFNNDYRCV